MKHKVKTLTRTCDSCPVQWEGMTFNNEFVYIRYRFGCLQLSVSDTEVGAVLGEDYNSDSIYIKFGNKFQGNLSLKQMLHLSCDFFDFSECEFLESETKLYIYTIPVDNLTTSYELLGTNPLQVGREPIYPEEGTKEITADKKRYIQDESRILLGDWEKALKFY